MTFLYVS